jgi:hypothetical protein
MLDWNSFKQGLSQEAGKRTAQLICIVLGAAVIFGGAYFAYDYAFVRPAAIAKQKTIDATNAMVHAAGTAVEKTKEGAAHMKDTTINASGAALEKVEETAKRTKEATYEKAKELRERGADVFRNFGKKNTEEKPQE